MKFVLFYHSLVSDWNHGNAHFLRGVVRELARRGHEVEVWEPADGWSRQNLMADHGKQALRDIEAILPDVPRTLYRAKTFEAGAAVDGADVVIVHEWTEPEVVRSINRHRARRGGYALLFHDTHHRAVSAPEEMRDYELDAFDGVLAFGEAIREIYDGWGWGGRAWTWHEAADVEIFRPLPAKEEKGDVVWVGNWGDGERNRELAEFLLEPVRRLGLKALIHGVRYPREALQAVELSGARYGGWLPNHRVPEVFARHHVTVHVPRRWYVDRLPGIPTIRVFEALACGIPLITAPWQDSEHLFKPGDDYLIAGDGAEMQRLLRMVLNDVEMATQLADHGIRTIRARHTCAHRVDELLALLAGLGVTDADKQQGREVA